VWSEFFIFQAKISCRETFSEIPTVEVKVKSEKNFHHKKVLIFVGVKKCVGVCAVRFSLLYNRETVAPINAPSKI
jgi:hypothetical protein